MNINKLIIDHFLILLDNPFCPNNLNKQPKMSGFSR